MDIEITLEQLLKTINNLKTVKWDMLKSSKQVLKRTLVDKVFKYSTGNKHIEDKDEMRTLISAAKGSSAHIPGVPYMGKVYNTEYLKRKQRMGELKPHKYENYGFWYGIKIKVNAYELRMKAKRPQTSDKSFDYLTHHERRRSVLKLAFVLGWRDIMMEMIKTLAKDMTKK